MKPRIASESPTARSPSRERVMLGVDQAVGMAVAVMVMVVVAGLLVGVGAGVRMRVCQHSGVAVQIAVEKFVGDSPAHRVQANGDVTSPQAPTASSLGASPFVAVELPITTFDRGRPADLPDGVSNSSNPDAG